MLLDVLLHRSRATNWAAKPVCSEDCAIHHIFPRELLKENGETRDKMINCLANLTLIAPEVNGEIGDSSPAEYLPGYVNTDKDVFNSHMIPTEKRLWAVEHFEEFLEARAKSIWQATKMLVQDLED